MKTPKRFKPDNKPYMGDIHIGDKPQPYRDMPFTSEAKPEELRQQIITLGKPIRTLLNNMDNGRCSNVVALAGVESAINGLLIALEALK